MGELVAGKRVGHEDLVEDVGHGWRWWVVVSVGGGCGWGEGVGGGGGWGWGCVFVCCGVGGVCVCVCYIGGGVWEACVEVGWGGCGRGAY